TTELTGFHAAIPCNHPAIVLIGTKALDRNVSGKSQMNPALCATSTLRTDNPIVAETQDIAYANRNSSAKPATASRNPSRIRQPTSRPHSDITTTTSALLSR